MYGNFEINELSSVSNHRHASIATDTHAHALRHTEKCKYMNDHGFAHTQLQRIMQTYISLTMRYNVDRHEVKNYETLALLCPNLHY